MEQISPNIKKLIIVIIAGAAILTAYWYGAKTGFKKGDDIGYKRAQAEIKQLEEGAAKKATAETAKAANPFQVVNPLESVETNPFQKAKKILNPFE